MKKLLSLENLAYLAVATLPLYLIQLEIFYVPTNVLEIIQMVIILWWFFDENYKKPRLKDVSEKYGKFIVPIGFILFGLFLSVIVGGEYRIGAGIIKSWFVIPLLFSFVLLNIFQGEKIKNILSALYFSTFFVSLIALVYYFFGNLTYDGRLQAFFNSPNYLAMFLAPGIIIGFFYFEESRIIYGLSLAAILPVFYLTFSYGAWVSVFGAILIVLFLSKKITKKTALGALLVLIMLLFFQSSQEKWADLSGLEERSSLSSRIMIWKTAGKLAEDNLLWGIGPGTFQEKYLEYQKFFPPYLEWAVPHPHSLFLSFFLYTGMFGFIGFINLAFYWLKKALEKENSKNRSIFLAIMIYILLHGLVDTTYFKNDLAVIFWLCFLVLNLKKDPPRGLSSEAWAPP